MKKGIVGILLVMVLVFSGVSVAQTPTLEVAGQEMAEAVRENPVNIATYIDSQIDYWAEILARLLKTGKPMLMFDEGTERVGLSATAIENVFMDKANLVIGWTLMNEEPAQFFYGVEVNVELSGVLGEIFSRLRPAVYVVGGEFLWGFGFELR